MGENKRECEIKSEKEKDRKVYLGFSTSNEWADVRAYVFVPPACHIENKSQDA